MSLYDDFMEQRRRLMVAYIMPTFTSFSPDGFMQAMKDHADSFGNYGPTMKPTTFMGLPYKVDNAQTELLKVQSTCDSPPISFRVDHLNPHQTTMQIVGKSLTAAQLCDIARAWLDADDASHWGEFEKGLDELITKHGRFE